MDDFKKLTEQLMKIYSNAESENYFDENISLIGTGKHELFANLHEFLESFKFDVKRRGKIRIEVQNLHQIEERLDDDHVLAHGTVDFVGLFKDGSICFKMETRFTIIYKWTNGKWLVQHLHQSIPDLEQMDGEEFPVTLGKQVKKNRQAFHALGTAYYLILRLNLKTKRVEFVKKNRKINIDIKDNNIEWNLQIETIERIIAEPFVQKCIDFFDIQTMAARLHNKESMSSEFKLKEGSWFLSMVIPQNYDKNGNVTSVLIANRDVTDEKMRELRQEEELREAKLKAECANKAKSSFLFNMSHDIRTPMNAIIGITSLIRHDAGNKAKVIEYADKIDSSSQHLLGIINDVLDMSKIEAGKTVFKYSDFSILDLVQELDTIFHTQIYEKQQTLTIIKENIQHEWVNGDQVHLMQIFSNLLSNAVKYTQEGGKIQFFVEECETKSSVYAKYRFLVSDNGMGMSADFKDTIFDAFTRAESSLTNKIQGTGLGMAITKNLVEAMGGTIDVESELGQGSCFEVLLDLKIAEDRTVALAAQEETDEQDGNILQGMRFLCAEDNELNAEILIELLKIEGAECTICENGEEILKAFEQSVPGDYDMILMDVQMPVMNGYEATKAIRRSSHELAKKIPIIAMTANAFSEDIQHSLAAGMNAHISKPVEMKVLEKTIRSIKSGGGGVQKCRLLNSDKWI